MPLSEKSSSFSCEHWFSTFEQLAYDTLKGIQGSYGSEKVSYDQKKLLKIKEDYTIEAEKLKDFIYGDERHLNKIDQHKIIAIYIKLILKHKPFTYEKPEESKDIIQYPSVSIRLINENYCIIILTTILMGWHNIATFLEIPRKYKVFLLSLLYHCNINIVTYEVLTFSHIIYFLENHIIKN